VAQSDAIQRLAHSPTVDVAAAIAVGVLVANGVGVLVSNRVGVLVGTAVSVGTSVLVGPGVSVGLGVTVIVGVGLGVGVGVGVGSAVTHAPTHGVQSADNVACEVASDSAAAGRSTCAAAGNAAVTSATNAHASAVHARLTAPLLSSTSAHAKPDDWHATGRSADSPNGCLYGASRRARRAVLPGFEVSQPAPTSHGLSARMGCCLSVRQAMTERREDAGGRRGRAGDAMLRLGQL
jgi:hypothetical protein